jgi:hypothetical protein
MASKFQVMKRQGDEKSPVPKRSVTILGNEMKLIDVLVFQRDLHFAHQLHPFSNHSLAPERHKLFDIFGSLCKWY